MEELILTREELIKLFESEKIVDTGKAWIMDGIQVDIIALHNIEPKFLQDITRADFYKIIFKSSNNSRLTY